MGQHGVNIGATMMLTYRNPCLQVAAILLKQLDDQQIVVTVMGDEIGMAYITDDGTLLT
jgi:hypothetical protein